MEIHQLKVLDVAASDVVAPLPESSKKRRKVEILETIDNSVEAKALALPIECEKVVQPCDMEDVVAVKPSFCGDMHFYGVYDGHGCSHALKNMSQMEAETGDGKNNIRKSKESSNTRNQFNFAGLKSSKLVCFFRLQKQEYY
ncbi:hypothetical protein L1887_29504 [Cichorium endivia]|nr:hypothetical protein L1887_29504 [Cichorium endivia]